MSLPNLDALQVIADPSRRQILQLLTKETYNINALAENFDMSRPAVSKHIKILQQAGFISIQEIGRERHCVLNQKGFNDVKALISHFDQFWENKLSRLETILNKKKD
ncbi:MAG: metalloregulator ArsR/SmtB family transcription factor [Flavobacterium nitrogenifigens]|jgi:DNA-binding transcriptional ArsR family regulator|uniref:ArsR/SmtB family transcription factor n=1 Tax=Flavobacterium branchiicola TaxID=1114875 RepID=A0ABV9P882_9FLAO|nr:MULTISPECIES: metalloregulator ArsR/SmtB family transcription factor [Flavobacterium]MBS7252354.1 winged helix-turn-helix transcriptional regulator [Flavobacterium branchiicola]MDQ8014457.1 metalloregulator ArsR/SmtB family transcription factor [Flavobacterium nitrogenifigens]WDF64457.1 metalloregulator ArsR/SmtB family transcription factor [Flavobacterium sp. KACC 22763]